MGTLEGRIGRTKISNFKDLSRVSHFFYFLFLLAIKPKSRNEDKSRKEFILNVLLTTILVVSVVFLFFVFSQILIFHSYSGINPYIPLTVFACFLYLHYLSRVGYFNLSAYSFIALLLSFATYTAYKWGITVPAALLGYALVITITSILINTRVAFSLTLAISSIIFLLGYCQVNSIISVATNWKNQPVELNDVVEYSIILAAISIVSWLSNREIEKSLKRAHRSEFELKKERDSLEFKVQKRSEELNKMQSEKMRQLYHFAEFGRISSGLFHDLINHLSELSLNLEILKNNKSEVLETRNHIDESIKVSHKMENFIDVIRKQIKQQGTYEKFSIGKEIKQIVNFLNFKAKKQEIKILFFYKNKINIFGDPVKFNHALTNIVSNAIDSYDNIAKNSRRLVNISLIKEDSQALIKIRDWGSGISKENLSKIFDIFFTTKTPVRGSGIGLSSTKEIIERDFYGLIKVKSEENTGTTFIIRIPIANGEKGQRPE